MMELPTLYTIRALGKIAEWTISCSENEDGTATIYTVHGYVDGKKINDEKLVTKTLNKGKANEKSPYENACSQIQSKWNKKYDKGARTSPSDIKPVKTPMLAHKYTAQKKKAVYPLYVQPKLDGVRALVYKSEKGDDIYITSRGGNEFTAMKHLKPILSSIMDNGEYLDGELYIHGKPFEWLISRVRKYYKGESETIEFHVFDKPSELPFFQRWDEVLSLPSKDMIKLVDTELVADEAEMNEQKGLYIQDGYEGIMLRNTFGLYRWGKKSYDLFKLKDFLDSEFKIVGITEGDGHDKGAIMFVCEVDTASGVKEFTVRPKGTVESRRSAYEQALADDSLFLGEQYTVRYQELSEYGVPRFPVGVALRNYE